MRSYLAPFRWGLAAPCPRRGHAESFDLEIELERPYLARMLRAHDLEHEEQAMIEDNQLPALGRWYVARP